MKSRDLDRGAFDAERADFEGRPRYEPGAEGRTVVRFRFDLDAKAVGEALLVVSSQRAGKVVYLGAYHPEILVGADSGLTAEEGWDSLEFRLFQPEIRRVSSWMNDRGFPYWSPGKTVAIALHEEGEIDDDNLLREHGATVL